MIITPLQEASIGDLMDELARHFDFYSMVGIVRPTVEGRNLLWMNVRGSPDEMAELQEEADEVTGGEDQGED